MKNERGSILSVAIIMIVVLSFSISSVSAYTYRVATRTNTTVEREGNIIYSQAMIKESMSLFREFISAQGVSNFQDLNNSLYVAFIEALEADYNVIITMVEENTEMTARRYRFSHKYDDESTVSRELYISLSSDTESETDPDNDDLDETITNLFETILFGSEDLEEINCEESENCLEEFREAIELQRQNATFNSDILFEGELDLETESQQGSVDLNGSNLLIDGDLNIINISEINGPGSIIVLGNLNIEATFGTTINNVAIFVAGRTTINYIHSNATQRVLQGTDFVIMSFDVFDGVNASVETPGDTYFNELHSTPDFRYIGDKPFSFYGSISKVLEEFESQVTYSGGEFVFDEGGFEID